MVERPPVADASFSQLRLSGTVGLASCAMASGLHPSHIRRPARKPPRNSARCAGMSWITRRRPRDAQHSRAKSAYRSQACALSSRSASANPARVGARSGTHSGSTRAAGGPHTGQSALRRGVSQTPW